MSLREFVNYQVPFSKCVTKAEFEPRSASKASSTPEWLQWFSGWYPEAVQSRGHRTVIVG